MYRNIVKRMVDFIISLIGLLVLLLPFLFIGFIIKTDSKGPILFKQTRVGKNNRPFKILKFRTMRVDTPKNCPTHMLENPDFYITNVGKFLRKTSLDEIPQIWNILIGDMSIIGPRPSLPSQTDLNELRDINLSSTLRPGLTGLAQVKGRDELPIDIKAAYDGEYYKKIGFLFDVKIFFLTIISVLKSDGIKEGKT